MAGVGVRSKAPLDARVEQRLRRSREQSRITGYIDRDPRTGLIRRGRVVCGPETVTLRLPKRLESPSRWLWGSWRTKKRAKDAWMKVIQLAVCDTVTRPTLAAFRSPADAVGWSAPNGRARVTVRRLVARRQHFIADRDNRYFAGKGLMDCLVQAGFLRDDTETAIDMHVEQGVSADGLPWTEIDIAPLAQGETHAE